MHKVDQSRQKALYHLLLASARQINSAIHPHKKTISVALKTLSVEKNEGLYTVSIEFKSIKRTTNLPVSMLKFYDTHNDPIIAMSNRKKAIEILYELLPELPPRTESTRKISKVALSDAFHLVLGLSFLLANLIDSNFLKIFSLSFLFVYLPLWNFLSNSSVQIRGLTPMVPTAFMFMFSSQINDKYFFLIEGLFLSNIFTRKIYSSKISAIRYLLVLVVLVTLIYSGIWGTILVTIFGIFTEIVIKKVYSIQKNLGLVFVICSLLTFFSWIIIQSTKFSYSISDIIVMIYLLVFAFFTNLIANSRGGYLRIIIPITILISGLSMLPLLMLFISIGSIPLAYILTRAMDRG